ncbi:phospholipase D-like domain-containing protein [Rufibacter soli]
MAKAAFSQIEGEITEYISKAEKSILIAVAWFTNKRLSSLLLEKLSEGVSVELIIRDDHINNSDSDASLRWAEFLSRGGRLYFPSTAQTMHNKYCIFDGNTTVTGSYNWTYQAEHTNQENIITVEDYELAKSFFVDFNRLKGLCQTVQNSVLLNQSRISDASAEEREYVDHEQRLAEKILNFEELLLQADDLYCHKRYEEAAVLLQNLISSDKTQAGACHILANVRFRQSQFEEQLRLAELGLRLEGENADLHNVAGLAKQWLGDYLGAIKCFDKAISLSPDNTDFYYNKYLSLKKSNQVTASDNTAHELITVSTNLIRKWKEKGRSPSLILKTHINRGLMRTHSVDRQDSAAKAYEIFEGLPEEERDYHDLDNIDYLKAFRAF